MELTRVNMNVVCKVKLTKYGNSVLESHYKKSRHIEEIAETIKACHKPDENGAMSYQLWELFQIFGSEMHWGMREVPFQDNVIDCLLTTL